MIDDEIYDVDAQSRTASRYLHDHGLFTESRLIDELLKEKEKLLDMLEAAQKDAARYQWLRENRFHMREATSEGPAHPALEAFEFDHFAKWPNMHTRQGLDLAIDAAIGEKQ